MNKVWAKAILLLSLCSLSTGFACDEHGKTGIMEDNDLRIYSYEKANTNGMTSEVFHNVINEIEEIYKPIFSEKGKKLFINKDWEDSVVNAYAKLEGRDAYVHMSGGLARHPVINADSLALVVCHEVGHHIGGTPTKGLGYYNGRVSWASNEGQADYWGALKCMRRFLANKDNVAYVSKIEVPEFVRSACEERKHEVNDQAICMRTVLAGYSLANMFRSIRVSNGRSMPELSFVDKDPNVVKNMDDAHPKPQCRLDTYFSGSLCDKEINESVSYTDFDQGVCTKVRGYDFGIRPRCWFKPPVADLL